MVVGSAPGFKPSIVFVTVFRYNLCIISATRVIWAVDFHILFSYRHFCLTTLTSLASLSIASGFVWRRPIGYLSRRQLSRKLLVDLFNIQFRIWFGIGPTCSCKTNDAGSVSSYDGFSVSDLMTNRPHYMTVRIPNCLSACMTVDHSYRSIIDD